MHVGEIIHRLRKEKKMTLEELSAKCGTAVATLSRIENGKMTGTLHSHMKICDVLGIALPDFYKGLTLTKREVEVQSRKARTEIFVHNKGSTSEMLASKAMNKKMMPVMIKLNKSGVTHNEETRPGIEKFIYVLDGKIEAYIGDEKYDMTGGDTLYFESSLPHYFKNTGSGESRLICVICPPTL